MYAPKKCDELFVKNTPTGREFAPDLELAPAYPGAKPGMHIPKAKWENTDWMAKLVRIISDKALKAKK